MKKLLMTVLAMVMCLSASCTTAKKDPDNGGETPRPGYDLWTSGRSVDTAVTETKSDPYTLQEGSAGDFSVSYYFSNNMIVPRDKEITIWGSAPDSENGKVVAAEFKGIKGSGVITDGAWKIVLQGTLPASGDKGNTLIVSGAAGVTKEFEDVLVGDVWVVSGQSNADLTFFGTVSGTSQAIQKLYKDELSNATADDNVRIFRQINMDYINNKKNVEKMSEPQSDVLKSYKWNIAERKRVVGGSAQTSFSMLGYFFAKELYTLNPDVPIGIIMAACGGAPLSVLASKEANDAFPKSMKDKNLAVGSYPFPASGIYNVFIAPLTNVKITGMIFYQGESDAAEANDYTTALGIFVKDLRNKFGTNFMFVNTQLTSYGYESGGGQLAGGMWDAVWNMRFAQSEAKIDDSISNYELVSTYDVGWRKGDLDGAHPYYKKEIGQRAAAIAAAKLYGIGDAENVGCPIPSKIEYKKDTVEITYDYAGGGLKAADGGAVTGFQILSGGTWADAQATVNGSVIVINDLHNPEGVRYAPENRYLDTAKANLVSGTGYPAAAFEAEFKKK